MLVLESIDECSKLQEAALLPPELVLVAADEHARSMQERQFLKQSWESLFRVLVHFLSEILDRPLKCRALSFDSIRAHELILLDKQQLRVLVLCDPRLCPRNLKLSTESVCFTHSERLL